MKVGFLALALSVALGLAVPARAQDNPAKEEPPKPEAAKEEPKPAEEAAPAADEKKEEAKPAEPAAAPAKKEEPPAAAPAAKKEEAPAKELSACAKTFAPIADSYKRAYDDMQKWIGQIDAQTSAASQQAKKLQDQVTANETAITQAKLAGDNSKAKSLTKENKDLWAQLNEAKKNQDKICSGFAKEASDRVRQYNDTASKALAGLKK